MPARPPSPPDCSPYDPTKPYLSPYDYQPSLIAAAIYTSIFGLSALVHAWQTYRTRQWWQVAFVLGAVGEFLGWLARAIASGCVYSSTLFEMQISLLIFSPAFTTAGVYTVLIYIIPLLSSSTRSVSPIPRKLYLYVFITVDFISLLLQAIGGGMAASAAGKGDDPLTGTNIMISGIIFQLASLVVFATLMELVLFRGWKTLAANRPLLVLSAATMLSVTAAITRGIYRSIELLQGWKGYLIENERFAIALDGGMIVVAVVVFNVFNPGSLLKEARAASAVQREPTVEDALPEAKERKDGQNVELSD